MNRRMVGSVRCVVPAGDICGEAAVWDDATAALYWTDLNRFLVHRHDTVAGTTRSWLFDEPPVALALSTEPGLLLVALASRLLWWRPEPDQRSDHGFRLPDHPRRRMNDGRAAPDGSFWIGTMPNNIAADGAPIPFPGGEGQLLRLRADSDAPDVLLPGGIALPNTLCWTAAADRFLYADTVANRIDAWRHDPNSGTIDAPRPLLAGFSRGLPDGSAIDREGCLWNCRYGGGCVVRIAPDGTILSTVEMPVRNPTTCAFGGPDLRTLFVTSARDDRHERLAGSLFAYDVEQPGLPERRVRAPDSKQEAIS